MEIRVLGPVEVVAGDGRRVAVAQQPRRLLAVLVAHAGTTASADVLLDAIWGAAPPASAQKLLHVYVSRLRKTLEDPARIQTVGSGYRLDCRDELLDADRFERLVREGGAALVDGNAALAASRLRRALGLWRGAAYGEFALEEFARHEAERLETLRWTALEARIDAELELGGHDEVLSELQSLAAREPLRERLQAQLMLALFRAGRQSEALDVYSRARAYLLEELGLDPGDELEEMQRRILQHDPTLTAHPHPSRSSIPLPVPANAILGRERELADLADLLFRGQVRFLVLTGAGGSGKTRLALEAARTAQASFAQGAVFVDLAPLPDGRLLASTIARALGITDADGETIDGLVAALRQEELLLVLDNAEHLRSDARILAELITRAPNVTLLVTSRVVLHVTGEHVFPVQPLPPDAALELLVQRAQQAGVSLPAGWRGGHSRSLRLICERLDGLPLAIELAATRMRVLAPPELVARLDARLPLLTGGARDLPARQQTLRATIMWSHDLLAKEEQRLFARLGVFAGGCSVEAAEAVVGATIDDLQSLIEHNLVRRDSGRLVMFETIREYAVERLEADAEAGATRDRHATYYLGLAERAEPELSGERQAEWLQRLDQETENFRAALRWTIGSGQAEVALRIGSALTPMWYRRGYLGEGRAWLEEALATATRSRPARAKALGAAAVIASVGGDWGEASRWSTECFALSQEIDDVERMVSSLLTLGRSRLGQADPTTARELFEQATTLAADPRVSRSTAALAAFNLGYAALGDQEYEEARRQIGAAQAAFTAAGDAYGVARSLAALGAIDLHQGRPSAALSRLVEGLAIAQRLGDRDDMAWALELFGVALSESDSALAARLLGAAESLRATLGISLEGAELALHGRALEAIDSTLEPGASAAAFVSGRALPADEAVALALATEHPPHPVPLRD